MPGSNKSRSKKSASKRPSSKKTSSKHKVRLDGEAQHVTQRVGVAIVAKSPIERIRTWAKERGWRNLRFLSSAGSTYNHDYQGENAKGAQMPALNVFVRQNGKISHFYNTELMFAGSDPGQDPAPRRHDMATLESLRRYTEGAWREMEPEALILIFSPLSIARSSA
jgi:predicted dithiol-disulfide oxidoreductase (DUF899 family)